MQTTVQFILSEEIFDRAQAWLDNHPDSSQYKLIVKALDAFLTQEETKVQVSFFLPDDLFVVLQEFLQQNPTVSKDELISRALEKFISNQGEIN